MGGQGAAAAKLGRNPFHSGKFSERTIGILGNFSAYSPALFDIPGRKCTVPLNLTSSYTNGVACHLFSNSSTTKGKDGNCLQRGIRNLQFICSFYFISNTYTGISAT